MTGNLTWRTGQGQERERGLSLHFFLVFVMFCGAEVVHILDQEGGLVVVFSATIWIPCFLLTGSIWRQLVQVCIEFLMRKIATGNEKEVVLGGKSECGLFGFFSPI